MILGALIISEVYWSLSSYLGKWVQYGTVVPVFMGPCSIFYPKNPGPQTDRVLRSRIPAMEGPTPAMDSPRILRVYIYKDHIIMCSVRTERKTKKRPTLHYTP